MLNQEEYRNLKAEKIWSLVDLNTRRVAAQAKALEVAAKPVDKREYS